MKAVPYSRQLLSLERIHSEQWQLPGFTPHFPKFAEFSTSWLGTKTLGTRRQAGEHTSSRAVFF